MSEFSDDIPPRLRDLATVACADFNKKHIGHPMVREQRYEWLAADRIERLEAELAALREAAKKDLAADIECWEVDESDKEQHYNAIERKDIAHKRLASLLQEKRE